MRRLMTLAILLLLAAPAATSAQTDDDAFASMVDANAFASMAVYADGRVKSYESFATSTMRRVTGPKGIEGQSDSFTYLDMMLRPERYSNRDIIFVKKKPIRSQIATALRSSAAAEIVPDLEERIERLMEDGRISANLLSVPEVAERMELWSRDLIRTAKAANQINTALALRRPEFFLDALRVIPPASGDTETPWANLLQLAGATDPVAQLGGISPEQHAQLMTTWSTIYQAWTAEDQSAQERANIVNSEARSFVAQLAAIDPAVYPATNRLLWEAWYFRSYNLTWIWVLYALCTIPLLIHIVFRFPAAAWIGMLMFLGAFAMHTFALGLRWYVSDRWPNSNMFEAVTTSVWFGGCAALVLEVIVRRSPMRSVFFLGSAVTSMVALMCAWFMPVTLDARIENRMPVLHDVWLYIHTNVIIFSYALIFMAAITATLYLLYRLGGRWKGKRGTDEFARIGGAGSLIVPGPDGAAVLSKARASLGQVLDGTTMILIELSFIMLWAGLVMGAIWADHSWGRPWGWDPKEVFALNTFIVFAVLVHGRLKVKDKGMWTAWIALIGAAVMLFNWIAINFVITGLHSYA